jgi:hypothetical protein
MTYSGKMIEGYSGDIIFEHISTENGTLCEGKKLPVHPEFVVYSAESTSCEKCKQIFKLITTL